MHTATDTHTQNCLMLTPLIIYFQSKLMDAKVKTAASFGDSNLRRSAVTSRSRSKSPTRTTWVPPPAKTSKGSKLAWQVRLNYGTGNIM